MALINRDRNDNKSDATTPPVQRVDPPIVPPTNAPPIIPEPGSPEAIAAIKAAEAAKAKAELDFIESGAFMLAPELAAVTAPRNARSPRQEKMDDKVTELHEAWVKAGRPTTWDAMVKAKVVATYFSEPDKSAELKGLIDKAVKFHGLTARMGTSFKVTAAHVKQYNLPEHYEGREAISFAVRDKRPRGTSAGKSASKIIKG
jgi:hypothetical protein